MHFFNILRSPESNENMIAGNCATVTHTYVRFFTFFFFCFELFLPIKLIIRKTIIDFSSSACRLNITLRLRGNLSTAINRFIWLYYFYCISHFSCKKIQQLNEKTKKKMIAKYFFFSTCEPVTPRNGKIFSFLSFSSLVKIFFNKSENIFIFFFFHQNETEQKKINFI